MLWFNVAIPIQTSLVPAAAEAPPDRIRRTWRVFGGSLVLLAFLLTVRAAAGGGPGDLAAAGLAVLAGASAFVNRREVERRESARREEAESVARLVRRLSRAASPDAVVEAIAQDLAAATDADHVVVARRRPGLRILDATLVSAGSIGAASTTTLPAVDLDDPELDIVDRRDPIAVGILRPVATVAGSDRGRSSWPDPTAGAIRQWTTPQLDHGPISEVEQSRTPAPGPARVAERIEHRVRRFYGLANTLVVPLAVSGGVVGALVISRRTPDAWSSAALRTLQVAAEDVSAALDRLYAQRDAETRAATDPLTGLPNRRYFEEFCGLLARRRRANDALGVLMIDIDHFKRLNDRFGHAAGDLALKEVARTIMRTVRDDDVPARYGGEEFVVLLRSPSRSMAFDIGERVRQAVERLDLRPYGLPGVTVSVGVALADAPDISIAELVGAADRALYRAKRIGRNRVEAA